MLSSIHVSVPGLLTYALSADVQSEAHVALTAVAVSSGGCAPPVQTQVTKHVAHVGQDADVLGLNDI